ncbi:hypothetical protein HYH03_013124 [Edaphochlamys debaryana]|uniref:Uncharacterized protein n=1 Tax=Edaphochlamys debaryana TaxID=47281 RepID=A0A835XSP1_9CHLO|nr:hypothetical protein HYH03_013124 [Edaphochlamys debaryana]|eukprot:KAG2488273.1 hypothetical protein HYH03_013124 [Edaphochlamys debaryana]
MGAEVASEAVLATNTMILPALRDFLFTPTGSVLADVLQQELGVSLMDLTSSLTAEALQQVASAVQKAMAADTGALGSCVGRFIVANDDPTTTLAHRRRLSQDAADYEDWQKPVSLIYSVAHLASEIVGLDERMSYLGLLEDVSEFAAALARAALGASTVAAADPSAPTTAFAKAMVTLNAEERGALEALVVSIENLRPAIKDLVKAFATYPAPYTPRALAPVNLPNKVTASVLPALPATSASAVAMCAAAAAPAASMSHLLSAPLAESMLLQMAMSSTPGFGGLLTALPPVVSWYLKRWDLAMQPVLGSRCAVFSTRHARQ